MVKALDCQSEGHEIESPSTTTFLHIQVQIENANRLDTISINSIHRYVSNISMHRLNPDTNMITGHARYTLQIVILTLDDYR